MSWLRWLEFHAYVTPTCCFDQPFYQVSGNRGKANVWRHSRAAQLSWPPLARTIVESWRDDYNAFRPHSAQGNQTQSDSRNTWT